MSELSSFENIEKRWRNMPHIKKMWLAMKRRILGVVDFSHHIRRVRWFVQRGKRGYADCDVWEMFDYLTNIILPMLKTLREIKHGYPCSCPIEKHIAEEECSCNEKWDENIGEMIEGFEAAKRLADEHYDLKDWLMQTRKDTKIFEQKMRVFAKWFFHLWD